MQMTNFKKQLSHILCIVLIVAMALFTTACGNDDKKTADSGKENVNQEAQILGEGETQFTFTVTDADGKETVFTINTDETTVGAALLAVDLIAGDESEYGLYVKTVNGITVDHDKDGKYWAFYVNGEYAMSGADTTEITEGNTYSFKVE